jgi:hypothetical protein
MRENLYLIVGTRKLSKCIYAYLDLIRDYNALSKSRTDLLRPNAIEVAKTQIDDETFLLQVTEVMECIQIFLLGIVVPVNLMIVGEFAASTTW